MKHYNYEIIIYDILELRDIIDICQMNSYNYCYCKHDKDKNEDGTDKKLHYHFLVFMPYQKTVNAIKKLFDVKESQIQFVSSKVGAIRYLIHLDNPEKAQYNELECVSSFDLSTYFSKIDKKSEENNAITTILTYIDKCYYCEYKDFLRFVLNNNLYSFYRRSAYIINSYITMHNSNVEKY